MKTKLKQLTTSDLYTVFNSHSMNNLSHSITF